MPDASAFAPETVLRYEFAFARPELLAGRLFGITPDNSAVTLEDDQLTARFGPWTVSTPLANVAGAGLTGPYAWPKIIGPAHLSLRDRGLTFASNDQQGVCIRFRTPVKGIDPLGVVRHPGLTVTVEDVASLASVLQRAARLADEATARAERHPDSPTLGGIDENGEPAVPTLDDALDEMAGELINLSARELREKAKELGIDGASSMKKDELIEALTHTP